LAEAFVNEELEQLLRRCAAREQAAFEALHTRVAPQLLAVLIRLLRSRAAAEDALQDTFIRIWQQASQFDQQRGRAMAWLVSIARNRAIDLQRSGRPMVLLDAAEIAGAAELQVTGPADRAEFSSARDALWNCLQLLGASQRQCLVLAYQHGLTQDKIALSIGQPLGTVKSWLRRGLQALKQCIET
jgi:RNA polymerase sigma-70 factor (ECF subfamily)